MSDPFGLQRKLIKRVIEEAKLLDLDVQRVSFVPDPDNDGSDFMEAVFQLAPDSIMSGEEREQYQFTKDMEQAFLMDLDKPNDTEAIKEAQEQLRLLREQATELGD